MLLHDLQRRFADWRRVKHDIRRLDHLDDRLLGDVGVERRNIATAVRGAR